MSTLSDSLKITNKTLTQGGHGTPQYRRMKHDLNFRISYTNELPPSKSKYPQVKEIPDMTQCLH